MNTNFGPGSAGTSRAASSPNSPFSQWRARASTTTPARRSSAGKALASTSELANSEGPGVCRFSSARGLLRVGAHHDPMLT